MPLASYTHSKSDQGNSENSADYFEYIPLCFLSSFRKFLYHHLVQQIITIYVSDDSRVNILWFVYRLKLALPRKQHFVDFSVMVAHYLFCFLCTTLGNKLWVNCVFCYDMVVFLLRVFIMDMVFMKCYIFNFYHRKMKMGTWRKTICGWFALLMNAVILDEAVIWGWKWDWWGSRILLFSASLL